MAQSVRASLRLPLLPGLQGAGDELPAEQLIGLLLPHLQTLLEVLCPHPVAPSTVAGRSACRTTFVHNPLWVVDATSSAPIKRRLMYRFRLFAPFQSLLCSSAAAASDA